MSTYEVDSIPRHQAENPFNYTRVQLAEKKKVLKDIQRDFPHVPIAWAEMCYDFCENTPTDEIEKIIEQGLWDAPSKHANPPGGVLKSIEITSEPIVETNDEPSG